MEFIRFKNDENIYFVDFVMTSNNVLSLTFEKSIPESYLNGFYQINKNNGLIEGTYDKFTTLYYKNPENEKNVFLSNDGNVYIEPEFIITFQASYGGTLNGETEQSVKDYDALVIPTPIPNENYKFVNWNPEIPKNGKVESNTIFTAVFEYIPPLEEIKSQKKNELNNQAVSEIRSGVDFDSVKIPYTDTDKNEIKTKLEMALKANSPVTIYTSTMIQKTLSPEEIESLYVQEEANSIHHRVYSAQLFAYVDTLKTQKTINAVSYGQELTGNFLTNYNTMVEQENQVVKKYIDALKNNSFRDMRQLQENIDTLTEVMTVMQTDLASMNTILAQEG